jgi:DNA-binding NtrC family response regulator
MACDDMSQAEEVSHRLWQLNTGALVVYGQVADLRSNPPAGRIAAVIVDTHEPPVAVRRALEWMRHRWPGCPVTVVGDAGGGEQEMAARQGGASFLTRPVTEEQWLSLLAHAVARQGPSVPREPPAYRRSLTETGR